MVPYNACQWESLQRPNQISILRRYGMNPVVKFDGFVCLSVSIVTTTYKV